MKQAIVVINVALIIAVAILYLLVFKFRGSIGPSGKAETSVTFDSASAKKMAMVYVNTDSLLSGYELAKILNDQLIKKQQASKANFESKAISFEKEAASFQDKLQRGAFLSQQSAETQQQELLQKQQKLQQLEYDLSSQLAKEQAELTRQLYDSITNFLKEYNKNFNYNFILGHTPGSGLLYASEDLDITDTVIKALNARYRASLQKK
ncbi:MAG: hypothetical protein A2309_01345 [Bacteroidetes bacterium RIFOXYB2_FULL_35_7]|nr:MAG: hypothetical protein A2X01_00615 [Bacteroidetes bacterium GWF2_35_48]OFY93821.1 MAG: hypothetical protein A2309_01345 [Bacteroidetes bacterium RIFOXYB2_FULL_35_7]HBX50755.1 hypothetical protein [Bacteroidales bacterium]